MKSQRRKLSPTMENDEALKTLIKLRAMAIKLAEEKGWLEEIETTLPKKEEEKKAIKIRKYKEQEQGGIITRQNEKRGIIPEHQGKTQNKEKTGKEKRKLKIIKIKLRTAEKEMETIRKIEEKNETNKNIFIEIKKELANEKFARRGYL